MLLNNAPSRTIRFLDTHFEVIDQRLLPHEVLWLKINTLEEAATAIEDMVVRGAPLIGATAAYGMVIAALQASDNYQADLDFADARLRKTRPTAVNLHWALDQQKQAWSQANTLKEAQELLITSASKIIEDDVEQCRQIGLHGLEIIKEIYAQKKDTVNILTHCNAGWLACVDYGTATSPMYHAQIAGIPIHIWVDETRPRNQGAKLTAFELGQQGISHTIIADNTGGHLMQHGMVDMVIVGSDRTTRTGDVANKIGTYLKALAAHDNKVPFYAALPISTIDWNLRDGVKEIPIETRSEDEIKIMDGKGKEGVTNVLICPESSPAANYGFDVTPARLVTGIITERGIAKASEEGLLALYPENK